MSSSFCDLCIILIFGLAAVLTKEISSNVAEDEISKGNCTCGGFSKSDPTVDTAPLLSQTTGLVVKCEEEGAKTCKSLCTALATATKAKGPEILCNKLKNANELKLSAFYKICDKPWTYANMTAETPLCCEDGKVQSCVSVSESSTPTSTDN